MSHHGRTAARRARSHTIFHAPALTAIAVAAATAFVFGCSADSRPPVTGPDPSNPQVRVPAASYRSPLAPYESLRPVEPAPWLQQNQQVTPSPKR